MHPLPLVNALAFAAVIAANAAAVWLPLNGYTTGELSALYPNLFVPAGYAFSIWGLIYGTTLGYVAYGFTRGTDGARPPAVVRRVGWCFAAVCALNVAWIFAWHYRQVALSVAVMLAYLTALVLVYGALRQNASPEPALRQNASPEPALQQNTARPTGPREALFAWLPFGLHLGWICVATVANVTAALVDAGVRLDERVQEWVTLGVLFAVQMLAADFTRRGEGVVTLVVAWAFAAIAVRQWDTHRDIATLAVVGVGLGLYGVLSNLRRQWFGATLSA